MNRKRFPLERPPLFTAIFCDALTFATLDKRGSFPMPQPPLANLREVFENLRFSMP